MLLSLLACAALPADSAPSSGTSLQDSAAPADTAPPPLDTAPSADLNVSWTFDTDTVTVIATAAAHRTYTLTTNSMLLLWSFLLQRV